MIVKIQIIITPTKKLNDSKITAILNVIYLKGRWMTNEQIILFYT